MKDVIVCLIGPSGVGKTTVAKLLEERGMNVIQSYTTRPPREKDEWGHTFVSEKLKGIFNMKLVERITIDGSLYTIVSNIPPGVIAHEVLYNGHHYWATVNQYKGKGISLYVIDPKGAKAVKDKVKDADVIRIYLYADENVIIKRLHMDDKRIDITERLERDRMLFRFIECDIAFNTTGLQPLIVANYIDQYLGEEYKC